MALVCVGPMVHLVLLCHASVSRCDLKPCSRWTFVIKVSIFKDKRSIMMGYTLSATKDKFYENIFNCLYLLQRNELPVEIDV